MMKPDRTRTAMLLTVVALWLVAVAAPAVPAVEHGTTVATVAAGGQHEEPAGHGAADHGEPADESHGSHGEAQAVSHGAAHAEGEGHGEEHDPYHLPNFVALFWGDYFHGERASYLDPIFSAIVAMLMILVMVRVAVRDTQRNPTRFQAAVEMLVEALDNMVVQVIGPQGRRYTPYLGTLFIFIWVNNLLGLVPFMHASTSSINTTVALAICTFLYVQYIGIKENGPLGYLHHLAGSPRSSVEWMFVPLMFPLHVLGEFIKPLSLSLRLFGNIMGEDKLIAVFVVLGAGMLSFVHVPFGIPIQVPIMFLALLTSTIQALVFALLSTVYIALMLPHEDHGEAHGH